MDMPDVPPQYAPVVIAQAPQAQPPTQQDGVKIDRTIGVCHLIQNPPIPPGTAVNVISPLGSTSDYFNKLEQRWVGLEGKVTVLQGPEHGALEDVGSGYFGYQPTPDYRGPDRATLLVDIGGLKVKVMYFFKVEASAWGGTEGYDPYEDKDNCPQGRMWKISLNPDDPNAPIYTFQHPSQLTSPLADSIRAHLAFADLPNGALGQTTGTTITLDDNTADHDRLLGTSK
jgi:hypothetical protein